MIIVVCAVLFFLTIVILFKKSIYNREKSRIDNELSKYSNEQRSQLETQLKEYKEGRIATIELELNKYTTELEITKNNLENEKQKNLEILKENKEKIENELNLYYNSKVKEKNKEIEDLTSEIIEKFNIFKQEKDNERQQIENDINDFKKKQESINEEIVRRRKMEEQQDFYRIVLPKETIEDLEILDSIAAKLNNSMLFDKLVFDNYISRPVGDMVKRVLNNEAPSGIYKITRIKTGEIYIGKAVNVKERWIGHIKTVYHIGNIATSALHRVMEEDGITNFTFELVEAVDKDKLTEREKYWISFYDSKNFGLNQRLG